MATSTSSKGHATIVKGSFGLTSNSSERMVRVRMNDPACLQVLKGKRSNIAVTRKLWMPDRTDHDQGSDAYGGPTDV
jgi:hypothetical protein